MSAQTQSTLRVACALADFDARISWNTGRCLTRRRTSHAARIVWPIDPLMSAWLIVSILIGVWAMLSVIGYERERRVREIEEADEENAPAHQ